MLWLTIFILLLYSSLGVYLLISDTVLIAILNLLFCLYFFISMLHKLVYKIQYLYYLMIICITQKKRNGMISKNVMLRKCLPESLNFSTTLRIECEADEDSFRENFWFIEYDRELRKFLASCYIKKH